LRRITRVFTAVKPLRISVAGFVAANDPAKIDRGIGNPGLHVGDQSAPTPCVGGVDRADRRTRAGSSGKIAPDIGPKAGVVEGVKPSGIVWLGVGALSAWFAGVGSAFTPIARHFAQRDRRGISGVRLGKEQGERCVHDRRIGRDRSEIECD
jgi:hypothetical protein